uniref:VIT domain-containing protein n=1 Tax=Chelonoidis abingdonii TaxID=106734 RepID=A0A8C0GL67_CHEAB
MTLFPPVPLRSGSVTVLIQGFVADMGCELLYRNDEQGPVEAVFVFPVDAEAAVYAFQARLGGNCIQAQLREKKLAQELYGDALEGAGGDVFSCSLGNLPPGRKWSMLHSCYTPHRWDGDDVTQGVPRVPQGELPYTLNLSATLQSPHGINRVLSNCPLTPLNYTAGNWTSAQVRAHPDAWGEVRGPHLSAPAGEMSGRGGRGLGGFMGLGVSESGVSGSGSLGAAPIPSQSGFLQGDLGSPALTVSLPHQRFVFTDGEVGNTQDIIAEVQRHRGAHRCFSFSIGEGASTALVKGIAQAAGGSAEFFTSQDCMQPKVLQSPKRALQLAVTGISLCWDLPPGMEAALLSRGPEVIFPGQWCLIYAQLHGQPELRERDTAVGGVTLQYHIQDQTYKEMLQLPLQPQDGDRLSIHRLAAKSLLLELEGAADTGLEGDRRRALETSLSSEVVCSLTAYVGVDMEQGQPVQGSLVRWGILLPGNPGGVRDPGTRCSRWRRLRAISLERAVEESLLLRLVSLQNADGSWDLDPRLAAMLPLLLSPHPAPQDLPPSVWATVLDVVWLHSRAAGQCDEWELLEVKAASSVRGRAGAAGSRAGSRVLTGETLPHGNPTAQPPPRPLAPRANSPNPASQGPYP